MLRTISIFGDRYKIRKTSDSIDYIGGIVGYDVYDLENQFFLHYDCEKLSDVIKYLRWRIYRIYDL
jgi:hypothetical protein